MYRVISGFADLQDNKHFYVAGDVFPRDGLKVTSDRITQLASSDNRMRKPLIRYVPDEKRPVKAKGDKNAGRPVQRNKELVRD